MTAKAFAVPIADYERIRAQLDVSEARLEHALDALKALVKQLEKVQGYSSHTQQAELREARAVIAESQ